MKMTNETEKQESGTAAGGLIDPVVMCWKGIESAPTDGTCVLVSAEGVGTWMAKYTETYTSGFVPKNKWHSIMLNHNHIRDFSTTTPTHWMPLPNALNT
jgi:hypothetical protein